MSPLRYSALARWARGWRPADDLRLRAGDGQLPVLACLAAEWQDAVDQGLGGQDLTIVTRTIGQQEGAP